MIAALMGKAGYARSRRKRALRWLDRDPDFCNGACLFPTIAMLLIGFAGIGFASYKRNPPHYGTLAT
jgi:hypothetical protein